LKDNKVVKAYWTAWRWPEVYSEDKWVIRLSRLIAIVIPISIVALAFLTGVPLLGLAAAGFVSAVMALGIILITINLFYQEYPTVENFDAQEARIKEFFHGFPKITTVPLIELEKDEWVAYGHVDPKDFTIAITQVILYAAEDHDRSKAFDPMGLNDSVGHLYATFKNPEEGHWEEGINLCKNTTENSFPITRLQL
jgi:ABC-type uncharacterized transport system fused permease/ATPase subunit